MQAGPGTPPAAGERTTGDAFRARVRVAVQHVGEDQLYRRFALHPAIRLRGARLKGLDRLSVADGGEFVVSDAQESAVSVFDASGGFLRRLGAKGLSPGQYQLPTGVASLGGGRIAVIDFSPKRLSVFDISGGLVQSSSYSSHSFSAHGLVASPDGLLSAVGISSPGGRPGAASRLLHQFRSDGIWVRSVLPLPPDVPAWIYPELEPFLTHSSEDTVLALAPRYSPFIVSAAGEVAQPTLPAPAGFRPPTTAFEFDVTGQELTDDLKRRYYLAYQDWRLGWTPVEAVGATEDLLLIQYQTFNPLRYTLDIWDRRRLRLLEQLPTNLRLLTVTPSRQFVFRQEVEGKGVEEPAVVIASLKPSAPER